jgi:hypothetical protein
MDPQGRGAAALSARRRKRVRPHRTDRGQHRRIEAVHRQLALLGCTLGRSNRTRGTLSRADLRRMINHLDGNRVVAVMIRTPNETPVLWPSGYKTTRRCWCSVHRSHLASLLCCPIELDHKRLSTVHPVESIKQSKMETIFFKTNRSVLRFIHDGYFCCMWRF